MVFYYIDISGLSHWEKVILINGIEKLPIQVLTPDLPFLVATEFKNYFKSLLQS